MREQAILYDTDTYILCTLHAVLLSHSHETSLRFCSHHEVIRWGRILHIDIHFPPSDHTYKNGSDLAATHVFSKLFLLYKFTLEYSSVPVRDKLGRSDPKARPGPFHDDRRSSSKCLGCCFPRGSTEVNPVHNDRLQCTRDIHQC